MNDGTEPSASHVITLRRERAQAVSQRPVHARWALIEPTLAAWRKARLDRRPTGQPAKVDLRDVFKREHMSDIVQAVAGLLSHQQTATFDRGLRA